jgi:type III restriction enzyme
VCHGRGRGARPQDSLVVEVDKDAGQGHRCAGYRAATAHPPLQSRVQRPGELDPATFGNAKLPIKSFTPEETREIVFKTMLDSEVDHTIQLDSNGTADYRSVVGFFARQLAEGPAPGRRLRPALPEGQGVHARSPVHQPRSTWKIR